MVGIELVDEWYCNCRKQQNHNKTKNNKTTELVNSVSIFYSGKLERQLNSTTKLKIIQIMVALGYTGEVSAQRQRCEEALLVYFRFISHFANLVY